MLFGIGRGVIGLICVARVKLSIDFWCFGQLTVQLYCCVTAITIHLFMWLTVSACLFVRLFVCSGVLQINYAVEEVNCTVTNNDIRCSVLLICVCGIKFCTENYCLLRS